MPDKERLIEELTRNLRLYFFEPSEIENIINTINQLEAALRRKALALCLSLSNVSANLVPRVLGYIRSASSCLSQKDMEDWLTHAFDLLDSKGLEPAISFLSKTDEACLTAFASPEGLGLESIRVVLETYIKAISGSDMNVAVGKDEVFTDTETIYLPPLINRFKERGKNFLLYKLICAHHWAFVFGGSLTLTMKKEDFIQLFPYAKTIKKKTLDTKDIFDCLPEREFALEVYAILEAIRLESMLERELPGLIKEASDIKKSLWEERPPVDGLSQKEAIIEALYQCYLYEKLKGSPDELINNIASRAMSLKGAEIEGSLKMLSEILALNPEGLPLRVFFLGSINPEKVREKIHQRKRALEKTIDIAIKRLESIDVTPQMIPPKGKWKPIPIKPELDYLAIKGMLIEIDPSLREIIEEKGGIPGGVLIKGSDTGRSSAISLYDLIEEAEEEKITQRQAGIKYDEWDFRRADYRKSWCTLFEYEVHPVKEPFVELILKRYGGYVNALRKRFELLRREPKIVKRQRDGQDIDIDAAVEASVDIKAGQEPSENIFLKLDRTERNIAVLFLIDMSGSTKGWINLSEREAIVMMCEALESLKDRYAIFGFSGMTRNRCDFYIIKRFEETYGDIVKGRIAGISPKDYTRMGPAIRHSTKILKGIEARTKLLITLSDGKPEDYDAYKGDYGIEDTRKSLIEAKEQGIHAFCITIDKEASSYLPHMYGEVNYIFIDDVRKLPNRITEIYRRLTA